MNENIKILIVCGRMCSGKGHFCHQFHNKEQISISTLIKAIVNCHERVHDASLDQAVIHRLLELIAEKSNEGKTFFIEGIRQLSIIEALESVFVNISYVWIESSEQDRRARFYKRKDERDIENFFSYDKKDELLGILKVKDYLHTKKELLIVKN